MINVKNRSVESWGDLANVDEKVFNHLINHIDAKSEIKAHLKKQKKLKTYKVQFIKESLSDQFEIQAESDWDISGAARDFFKKNKDTITFKEREPSKWAGGYEGYDKLSYVKAR